ncbi:MAG: putative hydrolase YxeP [Alphaproteobacteria bacterium UBA4588]|nr:MAG: putative hydrolase YxeP [Alphaproteobacteria bacterium UBA4588]
MPIINRISDFHPDMTEWRRALHAHPEICFEEVWTGDFIAEKLRSFGIEVSRGLGKTGVVGMLKGQGNSPRAIGLRADMDALPMPEENQFEHRSQIDGKMHACGHDGHMTMLLGAARYLAETQNFDGTVYFIFQPAEEGGAGGKAMVDDGLFEQHPIQDIWGMHNWPGLPAGDVAVNTGACMASADQFAITLTGRGSHAAMPHQAIDPILAAASLIQALQMVVSRTTDPLDPAVLSVTMLNGGSAFNVIPDTVTLGGTARAMVASTRAAMEQKIRDISALTAKAHGCLVEVDWQPGYPPTVNTETEALRAADVARAVVGSNKVHVNMPPSMVAEDFAFMLEERPGAYIWLGAGEAVEGKMLHNTGYDFNDDILPVGASYWSQLVESELPRS